MKTMEGPVTPVVEGPGKRRRMRTRRESGLWEKKMGVVWDFEVSWGSSGDAEEVAG